MPATTLGVNVGAFVFQVVPVPIHVTVRVTLGVTRVGEMSSAATYGVFPCFETGTGID